MEKVIEKSTYMHGLKWLTGSTYTLKGEVRKRMQISEVTFPSHVDSIPPFSVGSHIEKQLISRKCSPVVIRVLEFVPYHKHWILNCTGFARFNSAIHQPSKRTANKKSSINFQDSTQRHYLLSEYSCIKYLLLAVLYTNSVIVESLMPPESYFYLAIRI